MQLADDLWIAGYQWTPSPKHFTLNYRPSLGVWDPILKHINHKDHFLITHRAATLPWLGEPSPPTVSSPSVFRAGIGWSCGPPHSLSLCKGDFQMLIDEPLATQDRLQVQMPSPWSAPRVWLANLRIEQGGRCQRFHHAGRRR